MSIFITPLFPGILISYKNDPDVNNHILCEISSSHGGEYDVQSCLLGCTAV
jgi:hypothetical protein